MAGSGGLIGPERMWGVLGVLALALLGWKLLTPAPQADAEPTALLNVIENGGSRIVKVGRGDCLAQEGRLWVTLEDGVECISYVTGGQPAGAETVLVFLDGDVPEERYARYATAAARASEQAIAERWSAAMGLPVIIVGRPGVMGSTGFHLKGGQRNEAEVVDATITGLKEKFGFRRLALAGQSGGARLVAQLMVLGRQSIACAAMGSGAYGVPNLRGGGKASTNIWGDPGKSLLVPLREIGRIRPDAARRSFVIGDVDDRLTAFGEQRQWAEKLAAAGHATRLIDARARDSDHHGMSTQAATAAALCARGRSDDEIASAVRAL